MDQLDNILVIMRINELEGKYFWDIRELARAVEHVSVGEIVRELRCPDPGGRYVELRFDGRRILGRLTDFGRAEADRLLGMEKTPLGLKVKRRKPWLVDLTILYKSRRIVEFMGCRMHHFYIEPYFLARRNRGYELVEPEKAEIVLGVVKCTDRDKKERVPLRSIENKNMPPRIGLLFRYCIHNHEGVAEMDAELAKSILTIAGIQGLWGVRKIRSYVWVGGKKIDLRLL